MGCDKCKKSDCKTDCVKEIENAGRVIRSIQLLERLRARNIVRIPLASSFSQSITVSGVTKTVYSFTTPIVDLTPGTLTEFTLTPGLPNSNVINYSFVNSNGSLNFLPIESMVFVVDNTSFTPTYGLYGSIEGNIILEALGAITPTGIAPNQYFFNASALNVFTA